MSANKAIFKFSKPFANFVKGDEKEFNISFARGLQDNDKVGKIVKTLSGNKNTSKKTAEVEEALLNAEIKIEDLEKQLSAFKNKTNKQVNDRATK